MTAPSNPCHVLVDHRVAHDAAIRGEEIRAFATCRNERLRLPAFLKHYRTLGVDRFFIIDNHSTDDTAEYLAGQPDVHLFRTANRYSESEMGTDWLNALLAMFGVGSWCVTVDIDELLAYPGSERASLRVLTRYLDQHNYQALFCMLLDLYPGGSLRECEYEEGANPIDATQYFDAGPYEKGKFELCPGVLISGGMRERVFHPDFRTRGIASKIYLHLYYRVLRHVRWLPARPPHQPPLLTKVPLVRWDAGTRYLKGNHGVTPKIVAPETGVLLHVKFLQDFHARAIEEAARREHYDGASEYQRYAAALERNPNLTFMCEQSTRFQSTHQLVDMGLMNDSIAWVDARTRS